MLKIITANFFFGSYPFLFAQDAKTNWLSVVLGIALLLGLIGLLVWLFTTGKLSEWFQAGSQQSKARWQDMQFASEAKKTERMRAGQIEELGPAAWQAQLSDPSYAKAWENIQAVENQIGQVESHSQSLQEQLEKLNEQYEERLQFFDDQLSQSDGLRIAAEKNLKQTQGELYRLESDIEALADRKAGLQRSIKATRSDLINSENADFPDKQEVLSELRNRLDGLMADLLSISNEEPELAGRIPGSQSQVFSLNARVVELNEQIRRIESQKEEELSPIGQQMDILEKQLRKKANEVKELEDKMKPMIFALGPLVEKARPESLSLQNHYDQIDASTQRLTELVQEREEVAFSLNEVDGNASRNFYLLLLLVIAVIVLAILLITGVL